VPNIHPWYEWLGDECDYNEDFYDMKIKNLWVGPWGGRTTLKGHGGVSDLPTSAGLGWSNPPMAVGGGSATLKRPKK
jgi:hypothetical protein